MAKITPDEVVGDSEEEQPKVSKKERKEPASDADRSNGGDEGTEDENEYEIEAILEAKHGYFGGGRTGYLVKWKGYSDEHNSWVDENDAAGAGEMIEEYWAKTRKLQKGKPRVKGRLRKSDTKAISPDADTPSSTNKRKKSVSGRKSKSAPPDDEVVAEDEDEDKPKGKKQKRSPLKEKDDDGDVDMDSGNNDDGEYMPMDKDKYREKSWEKLVQRVDTIEKVDGTLKVFFTLNNGDKIVESSRECAKHFPQKLIQFYESNLRWREAEQ